MRTHSSRHVIWLLLIGAGLLLVFWLSQVSAGNSPIGGTIPLESPGFMQASTAFAAEDDISEVTAVIEDEAGISAYFDAGQTIVLNDIADLFRTIEAQTDDYILGSVEVPDWSEDNDIHVFIHIDGWVLAYYDDSEPTSKIFDWRHYGNDASIPNKLELGLNQVASQLGVAQPDPTYYHFDFPQANAMMLIAEWGQNGAHTFDIELPSSITYYEFSWSTGNNSNNSFEDTALTIDDTQMANNISQTFVEGFIESSLLTRNTPHTVTIDSINLDANEFGYGGIALIYQEP